MSGIDTLGASIPGYYDTLRILESALAFRGHTNVQREAFSDQSEDHYESIDSLGRWSTWIDTLPGGRRKSEWITFASEAQHQVEALISDTILQGRHVTEEYTSEYEGAEAVEFAGKRYSATKVTLTHRRTDGVIDPISTLWIIPELGGIVRYIIPAATINGTKTGEHRWDLISFSLR